MCLQERCHREADALEHVRCTRTCACKSAVICACKSAVRIFMYRGLPYICIHICMYMYIYIYIYIYIHTCSERATRTRTLPIQGAFSVRIRTVVPVKQVRICTLVPGAHEVHAVGLSQLLPLPHSAHTDAP
jgi:hypothetical protein